MTLVIGLTGGIGSGKTTVANLFANYGIDIIDADVIAREVVAPGSDGLKAIVARLGTDILLTDGQLNRSKLREAIFNEPALKAWLDGLLHPMIRQRMQQGISQASSPYCLLVVPLMVENQLQTMTDRLLVVDVSEAVQIARTTTRDNVDETQVRKILSAQATREQRLAAADDVIDNNGDSHNLRGEVARLHQQYLLQSEQPKCN
ncbi:dephospho-CoA kinase [Photobacterium galatheae]|uniref:Dephospho-CoA kinase n=1 Tax=Photobacterium galatheae TaxID=1654360 RepID=A0A066RZC7_9GAMM|nr:dephospho-CoA kinase [Photobacterium galatheae]KDM92728.1 dephospho-CoA kinase [Photobacterium galatheae]MCM0149355.1 dephospho-CoA kinase [Photobacterium galatheae]